MPEGEIIMMKHSGAKVVNFLALKIDKLKFKRQLC